MLPHALPSLRPPSHITCEDASLLSSLFEISYKRVSAHDMFNIEHFWDASCTIGVLQCLRIVCMQCVEWTGMQKSRISVRSSARLYVSQLKPPIWFWRDFILPKITISYSSVGFWSFWIWISTVFSFVVMLTIFAKAFVYFTNRVWPRRTYELIDIWMMGCVSANSLEQ